MTCDFPESGLVSCRVNPGMRYTGSGEEQPLPQTSLLNEKLENYLPDLLAYIRAHIGPALRTRETSRDVLQSVCREFLERQQRFEIHSDRILAHWLFELAFRKIQDRIRYYTAARRTAERETSPRRELAEESSLANDSPSHAAIVSEELERVEHALQELPEDHRQAVILAKLHGCSHAEIAKVLGRTEHACRMLLSRALARLAMLLDQGEERP